MRDFKAASDRCLTPSEVARRLNVSRQTITRACVDGRIKATRVGRVWRIPPESIEIPEVERKIEEIGALPQFLAALLDGYKVEITVTAKLVARKPNATTS